MKIFRKRKALARIHPEDRQVQIGGREVSVGRFTYGLSNLTLRSWGEGATLQIGSFCSLADRIEVFLGGNHRTDWITTYPFGHVATAYFGDERRDGLPSTRGNVVIGHDVWVGSGATLMSGVTIGNGAVIGAKAVVSKDVAPYEIVAGNSATHVKFRFTPELISALEVLAWWDLPYEDIQKLAPELTGAPSLTEVQKWIERFRG